MPRSVPASVSEISFPEEYLPALKQAPDLILESYKQHGPPIESGIVSIENDDPSFKMAMFLFHWVSETNDIIDNLNLILSDLRDLPNDHVIIKGSPAKRFYLLLRTFFHEFYRFRETFNNFVKVAANCGHLNSEDVKPLRESFHNAFDGAINIRNTLVHDSPVWKGHDHFELSLFASAWELDMQMVWRETGETRDISYALSRICPKTADELQGEAIRVSKLTTLVIHTIATAAHERSVKEL